VRKVVIRDVRWTAGEAGCVSGRWATRSELSLDEVVNRLEEGSSAWRVVSSEGGVPASWPWCLVVFR
jgi:hypothetical protein